MMKIPLLIVSALAFVLIGAMIGHNSYPIYAQTPARQGNSSDFSLKGNIASIFGTFTGGGPFEMDARDGRVTNFTADILAVHTFGNDISGRAHDHRLSNFQQVPGTRIELNGNDSATIHGVMDVGFNKKLDFWPKVPTTISIRNGTVLFIVLKDTPRPSLVSSSTPTPATAAEHFKNPSETPDPHGSTPIKGLIKTISRMTTKTN
jgi:hypothetical protein